MNTLRLCLALVLLHLSTFSHAQAQEKPWQGRTGSIFSTVTEAQAQVAGLPQSRGAMIVSVEQDGPAAQAGIKPGDIILGVNDVPVENAIRYSDITRATLPGTVMKIEFWRDGTNQSTQITIGETKVEMWPPLGKGEITRTKSQGTWWNAYFFGGDIKPLNGPARINFLRYTSGWEGMRFMIGDNVMIMAVPNAATVKRFAVPCGPLNVKWVGSSQKPEQPVLGKGKCVNGKPDGDVVLYGPDGLSQLSVKYQNGQPTGWMVLKVLRMSSHHEESIDKYILVTGWATTVLRDGVAWLEFGKVNSHLDISTIATYQFTGGQTDHLLPSGPGKCSRQMHISKTGVPGFAISEALENTVVPCLYTKAFSNQNGYMFTTRRDAAMDAEIAAFHASEAAQAARNKELDEINAENNRQRERERANDTPSRAAAPYVPPIVAEMTRLQNIQRDAERYGTALRAERVRGGTNAQTASPASPPSRTTTSSGPVLAQRPDAAAAPVARETPRKEAPQADPNPYEKDRSWRQNGAGSLATRDAACSTAKSRSDADVARSRGLGVLQVLAVSPCVCYNNLDAYGGWICQVYVQEKSIRKTGPADGLAR